MKNMNFRALENLKAPAELKEKLLAIPEASAEKPAAYPYRRIRYTAAAACLVLAVAVSVALFIRFGGRFPVELQPPSADETVSPTTSDISSDFPGNTENSSQPTTGDTAIIPPKNNNRQTESSSQSGTSVVEESSAAERNPSPTQKNTSPTQSASYAPTSDPTQKPIVNPTQAPTVKPSEKPTQPATQKPTQKPTQAPTQKPVQQPTECREPPTETPWVPSTQPTSSPTQAATESHEPVLSSITISSKVYVRNGSVVYCKITDVSDGSVYGDPDLYSDEHLAAVTGTSMNTVSCEYKLSDHGIMLMPGVVYYYTFYDADGRMLSRGSFKNR